MWWVDVGMRNRALTQDTNVERIAVATFSRLRERAHAVIAVRTRDKAVQRRRLRRRALRPIDAKVSADFVDFVFHEVEWCDFDVGIEHGRRVRADLESMPRRVEKLAMSRSLSANSAVALV
jgi:hypothetical protein